MTDAERGMRVRFWGTRGSVPSPGPATVRYGGNTPCITVRIADEPPLVFDAGTGIRALGPALGDPPHAPIDLFLTHTHWDHIQGLPFFTPLYREGAHLRIWGANDPPGTLERTLRTLMSPAVFPVPLESAGAEVEFRTPPFDEVAIGGAAVRALPVHHPGGAVGYRISGGGTAIVYVPDNELRGSDGPPAALRETIRDACRGAALLIHDSTYTAEESGDFRGWGHSTADEALELALEADVGTLVLFHHAPQRADPDVDAMVARCAVHAAARGSGLRVVAAAEGEELLVGPVMGSGPARGMG
ncbi:MAG TPA: MBL fold metallo-hydrolase [Gemmatimonadaceae bacterium]|nr:MBL fold metallo-hydrolase [Gemmatimonadaceae bacterium]